MTITVGDETRVNSHTSGDQFYSQISALAGGGWVVTWESSGQDGDGDGVYQQAYGSDGSAMGAEIRVNTYTLGNQDYPQVTALSDGGWVVTWRSTGQDGTSFGLYQQAYWSDGTPVGAETRINPLASDEFSNPQIAALSNGGWVVTWQTNGQDGFGFDVYQKVYGSDGNSLGTEIRVNNYRAGSQNLQQLTVLADGGWVVTWSSNGQEGGYYDVYQQRYDASGQAVGSETRVNTGADGNQHNGELVALADGGWIVTWLSDSLNGTFEEVYQQRYNASGEAAGGETRVNAFTSGVQYNQEVTALADGGWVVTWNSFGQDGDGWGVYQRRYAATGHPEGVETRVNTSTSGDQGSLKQVTALSNGGWVVTWVSSEDGSAYQQVYAADGDPIGTEMPLNILTSGEPWGYRELTALADGSWVVTGMGDDGSGLGVFQQRYSLGDYPLKAAIDIFRENGKASFLAQLAQAAYHLDTQQGHEIIEDEVNDYNQSAKTAYQTLDTGMRFLTTDDLAGLELEASGDSRFPLTGLQNGIYTNLNAAALVGRCKDALFISFRGTNDNAGEWRIDSTPDKEHWLSMSEHYRLFSDLIVSVRQYLDNNSDITNLYVTGHSLGASMVEALMDDWPGLNVEASTFASPGYGVELFSTDSRIINFWIDDDPILSVSPMADNEGDENTIFHNLKEGVNLEDGNSLHSIQLDRDFTLFFEENNISYNILNKSYHHVYYDSIYANVDVIDEMEEDFAIGVLDDTIRAFDATNFKPPGNCIILGGAGDDTLVGWTGVDHIVGGTGKDNLVGGLGRDWLYGGEGQDIFVFQSVAETSSTKGAKSCDRIQDFDAGGSPDKIDLGEIDAKTGLLSNLGNQKFSFIGEHEFTGAKGLLRFEKTRDNTLVMGDRDGDKIADLYILLEGQHNLAKSDFML